MDKPILRDIPESFETERMVIRVPRAGDGPGLNEAVLETFEALHQCMPWAKERPSVQQSEENSRLAYAEFLSRKDLILRLIDKTSGLFVGSSGLHVRDWNIPCFEVGYWCRTRFERQGYITEAVRGILRFGFDTLAARRIEIRCDSTNQRSIRVAQRVGMIREAELRNGLMGMDGTVRNLTLFAMTDQDWQALSNGAGAVRESNGVSSHPPAAG
jgi:RimJ/RimL family protein N-acetyltransferase